MKIQKILLCFFWIVAAACGKIDDKMGNKNTYDRNVYEKAQKSFCGPNRKLVQHSGNVNLAFQSLDRNTRVFGFSTGGSENCAVLQDINHSYNSYNGTMWFSLSLHGQCIQNSSLWEVIGSAPRGNAHYFTLRAITEDQNQTGNQQIDMSGSLGFDGNTAVTLSNIKLMECE